jgi:hypothetical protein
MYNNPGIIGDSSVPRVRAGIARSTGAYRGPPKIAWVRDGPAGIGAVDSVHPASYHHGR